jgi:hypothetical protein
VRDMNTEVLSFRTYKNLKSWLVRAGGGFDGGLPQLLKLILIKRAYEEAFPSGPGTILARIGNNRRPGVVGGTRVYAVRLPVSTTNIIRGCALAKHQGVSEWCSVALTTWCETFAQCSKGGTKTLDRNWITEYGRKYINKVDRLAEIYTRKTGREVSEDV